MIAAVLFILTTFRIDADEPYKPLTIEEAKSYIEGTDKNEIARQIIALDLIEHVIPTVAVPGAEAVISSDGRLTVRLLSPIVLTLPGDYKTYDISIDPIVIAGMSPGPPSWLRLIVLPLAGACAGAAGFLIGNGAEGWRFAVATVAGAALGFVAALIIE